MTPRTIAPFAARVENSTMNDHAIRVSDLTKVYTIWERPRSRLTGVMAERLASARIVPQGVRDRLRSHRQRVGREFRALDGISFTVPRGESVGIIGYNGSGKSTLLKIITGVLRPSSGRAEVCGRVGALLELGTGFNPDFTGAENVRLNAAIFGMGSREVEAKFAEIAAFAEIGPFIHQPVKTYSSGMMVRLAFAVHTALDPEILIIDEALSVGDEAFQRKCFARLERLREAGTTILFVSHDLGSVLNLTRHALFLHEGRVIVQGSPKAVVDAYVRFSHAPRDEQAAVLEELRADSSGAASVVSDEGELERVEAEEERKGLADDGFDPQLEAAAPISYDRQGAEIHRVGLFSLDGRRVNQLRRGRQYRFCYRVNFERECHNVAFAMLIKTLRGTELGGSRSLPDGEFHPRMEAGETHDVCFTFHCRLLPGVYLLNAGVEGDLEARRSYVHRLIDAAMFRVLDESGMLPTGVIDFGIESEVFPVNDGEVVRR